MLTISHRMPMVLLALTGVVIAVALAGSPAPATSTQPGGQTFEVTSTTDAVDVAPGDGVCGSESGECTLRAAIQETNALPGHQTVVLPAGEYVLTRNGYEENESAVGDLDITGGLTVVGAGTSSTAITEEAFAVDRIFDVREGAVVAISHLTIRDVFMSAILSFDETCGGGIRNAGDLTVSHVVIRDNIFRRGGGGVCNNGGTLRLSDSLISGNCACLLGPGGGVYNRGGFAILDRLVISSNHGDTTGGGGIANYGSMIVRDSLITANTTGGQAGGAGGIDNRKIQDAGSLTVINSTISGNRNDGSVGGGISTKEEGATTTLINSTVVGNAASFPAGGGISTREGATTTLINTVVADNENLDCQQGVFDVPPVSGGHNLDGDGSCGLSGPGDLSGVDPLLGELADNGGPTLTHALLAGSPAINAGDDAACPAADQRGAPRPSGAGCDIGAYEAGAAVPPPAALPGDVDCDGARAPFDLLALLRFVGSLGVPECIALGDLDCDGDADGLDALLFLRWLAGLIEPPCVPA